MDIDDDIDMDFGRRGRPRGSASDTEGMTHAAIAEKLGISRERVRQIEAAAFKKLNKLAIADDVKDLLEQ